MYDYGGDSRRLQEQSLAVRAAHAGKEKQKPHGDDRRNNDITCMVYVEKHDRLSLVKFCAVYHR